MNRSEEIASRTGIPYGIIKQMRWSDEEKDEIVRGYRTRHPEFRDNVRLKIENDLRITVDYKKDISSVGGKDIEEFTYERIKRKDNELAVKIIPILRNSNFFKPNKFSTGFGKNNHDGFRSMKDESGSLKAPNEKLQSHEDSLSDSEKERFKFETWLIKKWRNGNGGFLYFTTVTGLPYQIELKGEWSPIDERLPDGSMNTRILVHRKTPNNENDVFNITRRQFRKMFEDSLNYSKNEKYIVSNYNEFFSGSYFVPILKKYESEMEELQPLWLTGDESSLVDLKFDDFWPDYYQKYLLKFHKSDELNLVQSGDSVMNIGPMINYHITIKKVRVNPENMLRPVLHIIGNGDFNDVDPGRMRLPTGDADRTEKHLADNILSNLFQLQHNNEFYKIINESIRILVSENIITQTRHIPAEFEITSPVGENFLKRSESEIMSELSNFGKLSSEKEEMLEEMNDEPLEEMNDEPLEEMNDEPLSHDALKSRDRYSEITKKLLIDEGKIEEILVNLVAGKNILLTGAVGTGKTELARMIPEIFWNYYTEVHTATADWTTHDVIGGITPKMNNDKVHYDIENGCVTQSVLENWKDDSCKQRISIKKESNLDHKVKEFKGVWLCIDEFNRADIDKAFGQIFTSVESGLIRIPTNRPGEKDKIIKIPKDFRIIGTLNTADKFHLFNLSDALKRRFAIINIEAPGSALQDFEKKKALQHAEEDLDRKSSYNWESSKWFTLRLNQAIKILNFIRFEKPLGTAILKSIYQSMLVSREISQNNFGLDNALTNNLSAQLETVDRTFLDVLEVLLTPKKSIAEFFKKIENSNNDRQNYKKEFENYLRWTGMNEIEKRLKEFDEGKSFEDEEFKNEFNAWGFESDKATGNLNLEKFVRSIQEMKKSML